MRLLAVGDVCGPCGCDFLLNMLPIIKKEKKIDVAIVNGENSAEGNGISCQSADFLFNCGADVITGGNHSLRKTEINDYMENHPYLLRPANLLDTAFGKGYCLADFGSYSVAVINLAGKIYLEKLNAGNPFTAADELIAQAKADGANAIIVDFHAEATSEKRALGFYLDGKVSVLFGTHTHVQTADEQILPHGTGYITDIGMTGVKDSVLGVKSEIIINRLKSDDFSKFQFANGDSRLDGCIFEIDNKTGKTLYVERVVC